MSIYFFANGKILTHYEDHYEECNAAYHEDGNYRFSLRTKATRRFGFVDAASRCTSTIVIPFELKQAIFFIVTLCIMI